MQMNQAVKFLLRQWKSGDSTQCIFPRSLFMVDVMSLLGKFSHRNATAFRNTLDI